MGRVSTRWAGLRGFARTYPVAVPALVLATVVVYGTFAAAATHMVSAISDIVAAHQSDSVGPPTTAPHTVTCASLDPTATDGWAYDARVSETEGLVLTNVRYGPRLVARQMSVPYFNVRGSTAGEGHLTLRPEPGHALQSSFLGTTCNPHPDVQPDPHDKTHIPPIGISADYTVVDTTTHLTFLVHQDYRFDRYNPTTSPTDGCEATEKAPCARFWPTVTWALAGTPSLSSAQRSKIGLDIIERLDFEPDQVATGSADLIADALGALHGDPTVRSLGKPRGDNRGGRLAQEDSVTALKDGQLDKTLILSGVGLRVGWENWHQTGRSYVGFPSVEPAGLANVPAVDGGTPGCAECVHAHWSWFGNAPDPVTVGLMNLGAGCPHVPTPRCWSDGQPEILDGSRQDATIGWVNFDPAETDPHDLSCPGHLGWRCYVNQGRPGNMPFGAPHQVMYWEASTTLSTSPGVTINSLAYQYGDSYWPQLDNRRHGGNGSMFIVPARRITTAQIEPQWKSVIPATSVGEPHGFVLPVVIHTNDPKTQGPFYLRVATSSGQQLLNGDPLARQPAGGTPWVDIHRDAVVDRPPTPGGCKDGAAQGDLPLRLPVSPDLAIDQHGQLVTYVVLATAPDPANVTFALDAAPDSVSGYKASDGTVTVPSRGPATVTTPVAGVPRFVVLSPDGCRAYVSIEGTYPDPGSIKVLDLTTGKVTATFTAGFTPQAEVLSRDGSRLYVVPTFGGTVAVIDTVSGALVRRFTTPEFVLGDATTHSLALSPDGLSLYVAPFGQLELLVLDTRTGAAQRYPTSTNLQNLVMSPDGRHVYSVGSGGVLAFDTVRHQFAPATVLDAVTVTGGALTPDGRYLYVADVNGAVAGTQERGTLIVVDTSTRRVVTTIPVRHNPTDVVADPNGSRMVALGADGQLVEVSVAQNRVVALRTAFAAGRGSGGTLAVTADGDRAVVASVDPASVILRALDY